VLCENAGLLKRRIDLTAASAVHIIEPQWNPMAEAQAVDRVHRIGQRRDITVIRYIVSESIELVSASPATGESI
jgi:SNF2 family DNA or RNA helicase